MAGVIQAAYDVHHGGFAGTGRAHDGYEFSPSYLQRDPAQCMDIYIAQPVGLMHIFETDDRVSDGWKSGRNIVPQCRICLICRLHGCLPDRKY